MHHALHIDEVLNTIFNDPVLSTVPKNRPHVDHGSSPYKEYPLLSLALTCRSFYEPATRILWRRINGLHQLIRCMPEDVVCKVLPHQNHPDVENGGRFDETCSQKPYLIFKRKPGEEHWKNFDRLAAYVREFDGTDVRYNDTHRLGDDIFQALINRYSGRGIMLFPMLSILRCWASKELECLSSQELRDLVILFRFDDCLLDNMNRLPAPSCLKHIHFASINVPLEFLDDAPLSIFLLAHATNHLKSVHLTGMLISPEAVKTILQCQALEEMTLGVISFNMEHIFDTDMPRHSLKDFNVQSETLEASGDSFPYAKLARKLQAPNLLHFQFTDRRRQFPYASDIECLLETVLRNEHRSDENQVRTIRLTWNPIFLRESPGHLSDPLPYICTFMNALHVLTLPLPSDPTRSCASELRVLDLDDTYVDLSDKELGTLGASLPQIKSLIFSARAHGGKSRTTLTGLWLLAKQCPSLEALGLSIDAVIDWETFRTLTGFNGDHDSMEARVQYHTLARNANVQALYFGGSTVGDEHLAAEFFKTVFPRVHNVCYTRSGIESSDMAKWRAITDAVYGQNSD